jgi:hypothetical protein
VNLAGEIAATLPALRAAAERRMVDSCTITHPAAGLGTFDDDTHTYAPPTETPVYAGRCRVQTRDGLVAADRNVGERQITVLRFEVHVPLVATGIAVDDLVTITAARDPDLVGRRFRVTASHAKTDATARRLQCEELRT